MFFAEQVAEFLQAKHRARGENVVSPRQLFINQLYTDLCRVVHLQCGLAIEHRFMPFHFPIGRGRPVLHPGLVADASTFFRRKNRNLLIARLDELLYQYVLFLRRFSRAVHDPGQVGDLAVQPKIDFYRMDVADGKINVADCTVAVLRQATERYHTVALTPAMRADRVPRQCEDACARRVQKQVEHVIGLALPCARQCERANARERVHFGCGDMVPEPVA